MSWNAPPQYGGSGYQQYNNPPPQQGYGPPGQYNQGWNNPPPQQPQSYGGYAPPSGPPPQQGYGPPPGPPPQQGYGPPPGPPPQQQQYGGYQQGLGAPSQQPPYRGSSPQPPYGASPQQQPYGAPPQQGYGAPPQQSYQQQTPPSPGYDPNFVANADTTRDAEGCRQAMRGMGTNESALIQILTRVPDPYIMANLRQTYSQRFMRQLLADINKETSSWFCESLEALVRGPLAQDVHNLYDAMRGAGTKESVLNDVLLGRSNADINAIKSEYQRVYRKSLEAAVRDDLSLKTERLFVMILSAQRAPESAPIIPQELDRDVNELHRATEGTRMGADSLAVCHIFTSRSDGQLRAISQEYQRRYARPLMKTLEKEFSGHMEEALVRMLGVAEDRAMADAVALEETMKGPGTKDRLLLNRVVRLHWDKDRLSQVKGAYKHRFKKDLAQRITSDTSGDYRKLLVTIVEQR